MKLRDFNFNLPEQLIAHEPLSKRDESKLMLCSPKKNQTHHHQFKDILNFLTPSDVLVLNNTKVFNARLRGKKQTGAIIEVLLLNETPTDIWSCLIKPTKRVKKGDILYFGEQLSGLILSVGPQCKIVLHSENNISEMIERYGEPPLPPYITAPKPKEHQHTYQTVFAKHRGSVAAPTAGLHFTKNLLTKIKSLGVQVLSITLHVGYGTFMPIQNDNIIDHKMHTETFHVSDETCDNLNQAKAKNKRIIAVGTTSCRTLETIYQHGKFTAGHGSSSLFIYPGYSFNAISGLVTNFHLPQSSLLLLVSAFAGSSFIKQAYQEAISYSYRFFSYGDAMFITEPC